MWRQILVFGLTSLLAALVGLGLPYPGDSGPPENPPEQNSGDGGPYIDPDGVSAGFPGSS
jgi:hypothetical protein